MKNGTDAQLTKRLGPSREIVRWLKGSKKGRRIALLACKHRYSRGLTPRKSLRCRRCKIEGPTKKAQAVRKAA